MRGLTCNAAALAGMILLAITVPFARDLQAQEPDAELLLRKSFLPTSPPEAVSPPTAGRTGDGRSPATTGRPRPPPGDRASSENAGKETRVSAGIMTHAAAALGESWSESGMLYLPDGAGGHIALDNARFPQVDFGSGRSLILDSGGEVPAAIATRIATLWPGYTVLAVGSDEDPRAILGRVLDAAGYYAVHRGTAITFGFEALVRLLPDYVVLKDPGALLRGETYLLSVLSSAGETFPVELLEMAREQRLRIVEIIAGEALPGEVGFAWRDPQGTLTTVQGRNPVVPVAELAAALGLVVERRVLCRVAKASGTAAVVADLRLSRGGTAALVFARGPDFEAARLLADRGAAVLLLRGKDAFTAATVRLLEIFGIPRIGPTVEFQKPSQSGRDGRFRITVPGWLAEPEGARRLLITSAEIGTQLRLYLTREGIDIFQYRRH